MTVSSIALRGAVLCALGLFSVSFAAPAAGAEGETVKPKPRPEQVRPALIKKPIRPTPQQDTEQQPTTPDEPACTDCTDLTIGACEVQCFKTTIYSTELCQRVGYRSDLSFRAVPTSTLRNTGPLAVTFPAGARLWTVEGENPAAGISPSTGLYLAAGAAVPGPHTPSKILQQPAPGDQVVRFVIDPDNLVAETDETNNTSECRWTVVAPTEPLQPDLALVSVVVSPSSGSRSTAFSHTVAVTNVGNDDNSGYSVRCTPGSAWNQPRLAPGATHTRTLSIPNVATMPSGTHTVTCSVAPFAAEPNTSNNAATATFTIEEN